MTKKTRILSMILAAASAILPAQANQYLTVNEGNELSNTAPINLVYFDEMGTRTQIIYPASSLSVMTGEVINSMKFYTSEPLTESGGLLKVSIGETEKTGFTDVTYVEEMTQVATYSMTSGLTEVEITFDTPYYYKGGNLVFETLVDETTMYSFITFVGSRPEDYTAISRGEISKFLPQTTFDYGTSDPYAAKVLPFELTFKTIRAQREDIQNVVVTNTGLNGFTPTFSTEAPFSVATPNAVIPANGSLEVPVTFAPTAAGTFEGVLTIDCGEAGILTVPLHGTAIAAAQDLTVCDSTDYASYVPIYGVDIDVVGVESQMIYPASMLTPMAGNKITGLRFHVKDNIEMNGGVIQLSLKEVSDTAFASETLVGDLKAVATYTPVMKSTEMVFWFDEPFEYQGGNLLVDCAVIEAGKSTHRQTFFYGTPTEYSSAIYRSIWYGDVFETSTVPFLPLATFEYEQGEAPSFLRGDVNQDKAVNIGDVTALISILLSGSEPTPEADCDLDTHVSIGDVTALISYLLSGKW